MLITATAVKKPVLQLYTSPDNCAPCRKLEKLMQDPKVQDIIKKFDLKVIEPTDGSVIPSCVFPAKSNKRTVVPTSNRDTLIKYLENGLK